MTPLARAALRPSFAGHQEAITRHIENVVSNFQVCSPKLIELWIGKGPTTFQGTPIFANPVVVKPAGIEIGTQAAARACRNPFGAHHGDEQDCEVTANAHKSPLRGPRFRERSRVD